MEFITLFDHVVHLLNVIDFFLTKIILKFENGIVERLEEEKEVEEKYEERERGFVHCIFVLDVQFVLRN